MESGHRLNRLKHLLEKSSLYSDFLFSRMKEQESEKAVREVRSKKKAEKAKEKKSVPVKRKAGSDVRLADYATEADLAALQEATAEASAEKDDGPGLEQPSLVTGGTLRDYQLHGVKWLKVSVWPCTSTIY
jgi:ATP-dependent DNA helicase